jgi:hypothetical protein
MGLGVWLILLAGCATTGPTHLYLAGTGTMPILDRSLEGANHDELAGLLAPGDRVVGVGYEYNTDYIWLRMAPGNRLITIKRSIRGVWYRYDLPVEFASVSSPSLDLAVRSLNRMVYAAMPEAGRVGKVTRYGKVLPSFRPGDDTRSIGGLAWDQVDDRLIVLYRDDVEVVVYENERQPVTRIKLQAEVDPWSLAYDSNRRRYFVPLREKGWLGEFDAEGQLIGRHALPDFVGGIDAGQRAFVRVF